MLRRQSKRAMLLQLLALLCANLVLLWLHRGEEGALWLGLLLGFCAVCGCTLVLRSADASAARRYSDSFTILLTFLFLWSLLVQQLGIGDPVLVPPPMRIAFLMVQEFPRFLGNFIYSFRLFFQSFALSLVTAIPLGLLLGSSQRIRLACDPYIKVLSLVSPIAYIPYIIGLMPTFRAASLFVIFTGTFWPILKWTIYGVLSLDVNYTLTARLLRLSRPRYYLRVVVPGILPSVLSGVSQSISGGFAVLVAAEMIGSRQGLGFFIKYFADFLNYHMVLTGIIYLGISVCLVTGLYEVLQARLLSWQVKERKGSHAVFREICPSEPV